MHFTSRFKQWVHFSEKGNKILRQTGRAVGLFCGAGGTWKIVPHFLRSKTDRLRTVRHSVSFSYMIKTQGTK